METQHLRVPGNDKLDSEATLPDDIFLLNPPGT